MLKSPNTHFCMRLLLFAATAAADRLAKLGYRRQECLGHGMSGVVYRAEVIESKGDKAGASVAIKESTIVGDEAQLWLEKGNNLLWTREIPHVVKLLGTF